MDLIIEVLELIGLLSRFHPFEFGAVFVPGGACARSRSAGSCLRIFSPLPQGRHSRIPLFPQSGLLEARFSVRISAPQLLAGTMLPDCSIAWRPPAADLDRMIIITVIVAKKTWWASRRTSCPGRTSYHSTWTLRHLSLPGGCPGTFAPAGPPPGSPALFPHLNHYRLEVPETPTPGARLPFQLFRVRHSASEFAMRLLKEYLAKISSFLSSILLPASSR